MKEYLKKVLSAFLALLIVTGASASAYAAQLRGDVNADGDVTLDDALKALKYAMGVITLTKEEAVRADVDGDGVVSSYDAKIILEIVLEIGDNIGGNDDNKDDNKDDGKVDYRQYYLNMGFPKSYVDKLATLKEKYPLWEFVPFNTGLTWSEAVKGERTPHEKQLIEKSVASDMKCTCTDCKGVIFEQPVWMAASQKAVEYYLDPRNFLDEKHIFQFESTEYSASQTTSGVEAILKGTWMYNAYITYLDADGNTKTFTQNGVKMKYSEAIMKAAYDNKLSAYYLASKIVQEVGSTSASGAGGSSGSSSPYNGIYNYYNIGAYTGAEDGLEWANGYMCVSGNKTLYKTAATTTKLVTIPSGNELFYVGTSGDYYKVKTIVSSKTYTGYIKKSDASLSSSYGRPWDNPYKSIYYGAKYIYESFSEYQFTGYLQKFNVNKASGSLYWHEYMGNVRAAAFESENTYAAYVDGNILSASKTFSIPIFYGMPNEDMSLAEFFETQAVTLTLNGVSSAGVGLSWNEVSGATGYIVYKFDSAQNKYVTLKTLSGTTYTDTAVKKGETVKYKVRAYYKDSTGTYYSKESAVVSATVPKSASGTVNTGDGESLSLREKPSTDSTRLVLIPDGTTVTLIEKAGGWYKVQVTVSSKSYTGYCYAEYIKTTDTVPIVTLSGTVYNTDGDDLTLRSGPSTGYSRVVMIPEGTKLTIYGKTNGWYKVDVKVSSKKYSGYCSADYVKVSGTVPTL